MASPVFYVLTALTALFLVRLVVAHTRDVEEETRRLVCRLLGDLLGIVAVVYFLVRPFVVQTFWIPSESMTPALRVHDRIVVNCFAYRYRPPRRQDVVVFHPPRAAAENDEDLRRPQDYVKRLVGLGGERVRTDREGRVVVDGRPLDEPYVAPDRVGHYIFPECLMGADKRVGRGRVFSRHGRETFTLDIVSARDEADRLEAVVPARSYFLLGDNRADSSDGHEWGSVPADDTVGRAEFVFWPPTRVGFVR